MWGLHCEGMGCPREQQELAVLCSSCGQAATSNVCQEEMGPQALWWGDKGNAGPCSGRDGSACDLPREVEVSEDRSDVCLAI